VFKDELLEKGTLKKSYILWQCVAAWVLGQYGKSWRLRHNSRRVRDGLGKFGAWKIQTKMNHDFPGAANMGMVAAAAALLVSTTALRFDRISESEAATTIPRKQQFLDREEEWNNNKSESWAAYRDSPCDRRNREKFSKYHRILKWRNSGLRHEFNVNILAVSLFHQRRSIHSNETKLCCGRFALLHFLFTLHNTNAISFTRERTHLLFPFWQ
jgi:hypothetical protein